MANKMADKKKNASQSEIADKVRGSEKEKGQERSKSEKAVAREREERKERESRTVRREAKPSAAPSRWRNNRIVRFVRDSYHELRYKVTWPTFEEARNMTFVVIALSAAVAMVLGIADAGLFKLFQLISGK